jgi:outer membrane protein
MNEISQPISQLHRIGLGIKQAGIGVELTKEQLRAKQQTITANVRSAYYSILQTQSTLHVAEQNIRLYKELERLTDQYVLQRVSLQSEALEVKTRLAKSELEALTLEDTLATQKEQLNGLLGRDLQTDFSVTLSGELERVNLELQQAQVKALAQRPEIRQAKLKVAQAEADRRSKRAEYIPDVSLTFSHISPVSYSNILPNHIASAGVSVNWEVFDWGRKKHELAAKQRSVEQASNTVNETESLVVREVNANYRKLQRTAQQVRIALLAQETATETVRVSTNTYRANAALLKDVLQSEAALAQANDQYQQALLSFWTAKSEFDKSLGEDQ